MTDAEILMQMATRLTLGIPDDVAWRLTQVTATRAFVPQTLAVAAVVCLLWLIAASRLLTDVPRPPDPPTVGALQARSTLPKPPPPPPAPTAPNAGKPVFQYGRTSYSLVTNGPAPVRTRAVPPVYPPIALAAGVAGDVVVQARITADGRVTDAEVAPAGILGQSAIDAVQQWEFTGAGDRPPGPALLTVRVSFTRSR